MRILKLYLNILLTKKRLETKNFFIIYKKNTIIFNSKIISQKLIKKFDFFNPIFFLYYPLVIQPLTYNIDLLKQLKTFQDQILTIIYKKFYLIKIANSLNFFNLNTIFLYFNQFLEKFLLYLKN